MSGLHGPRIYKVGDFENMTKLQTVKGAQLRKLEKRSERRTQNSAGAQAGAPLRF